jgi:hypothetical protein
MRTNPDKSERLSDVTASKVADGLSRMLSVSLDQTVKKSLLRSIGLPLTVSHVIGCGRLNHERFAIATSKDV